MRIVQPHNNVTLLQFTYADTDCGDLLRYFLSWTNRKAGLSILHIATAEQLTLQETVVRRQM